MPITRRSLNFDFVRDGSTGGQGFLDSLFTFARASIATRYNASGILESVAAGVPRFDFDPATLLCRGLLIEESRTNLLLRSQELSSSPWNATGGTTVTPNTALAPDGTMTADTVAYAAPGELYQYVASTGTRSSLWLKGTAGETTMFNGTVVVFTGSWQRVSAASILDGSTNYISLQKTGAVTATSFYAWGAQMEVGAFATSYIPTTTVAVTRAAETCYASPMSPWFSRERNGTFLAEFSLLHVAPSGTNYHIFSIVSYTGGLTRTMARVANNSSDLIGDFYNLGTPGGGWTYGPILANTVTKAALAYSAAGRVATSLAGSSPSVVTGNTVPTNMEVILWLMGEYLGGQPASGWLRRLVYLPFAVDDVTLTQMTAS